MPDFWQFPTVSMGLGPMMAIYQARFMRYLQHRGLIPANEARVWAFLGDGEMDEPESLGAISLAARENLDNLTFVVNCNLQRLDGPVRGNGKIIQELEGLFRGAGWNVFKVIWGDALGCTAGEATAKACSCGAWKKPSTATTRTTSCATARGPRALLRQVSGAAQAGREPDRRRHQETKPRRSRPAEGLRRVPRAR